MAKKTSKRVAVSAATNVVKVQVPEKRNTNFFARVKKTNKQWIEEQAKANKVNSSEYFDLLCEKLRGGEAARV